jgi:hypothetical protein
LIQCFDGVRHAERVAFPGAGRLEASIITVWSLPAARDALKCAFQADQICTKLAPKLEGGRSCLIMVVYEYHSTFVSNIGLRIAPWPTRLVRSPRVKTLACFLSRYQPVAVEQLQNFDYHLVHLHELGY